MIEKIITIIAFVVAALLGWFIGLFLRPRPDCPRCRRRKPKIYVPKNIKEFITGQWVCPHCQTVIDARGKRLSPKKRRN